MSDIDELIGRLEVASEGSRELDAEIVVALDLRPEWARDTEELWIDRKTPLLAGAPTIRLHDPRVFARRSSGQPSINYDYGHYTTSLDAALTLVPDGFALECHFWPADYNVEILGTRYEWVGDRKTGFMAYVHNHSCGRWKAEHQKTPALALCAAALKARKAATA